MKLVHPLPPNEVHLWYVDYQDVAADDVAQRYAPLLDADETTRLNRFLFERDRRAYAVSHALLRTTLAHYGGGDPRDLMFVANNYGRPEIDAPAELRGLRFNLSHTRGAAIVGVVRNLDLGVDIETVARETSCVELAERYFSPREVADLHRRPPELQRDAFFDYWTLKEAYIKARGMGLAIALDRFSYLLAEGRPIGIEFAAEWRDEPAVWQFAKFRPDERYQAAVAVRRGATSPLRFIFRRVVPLGLVGSPVELQA